MGTFDLNCKKKKKKQIPSESDFNATNTNYRLLVCDNLRNKHRLYYIYVHI